MLDQEELLLVVDEDNQPLTPKPRSEVHKQILWHRSAHVWIINSNGQILCQRRSLLKDINPGLLCPFFGGHVTANETEIANAVTEIKEELGLDVEQSDFKFYMAYRNQRQEPTRHYQYLYIYLLKWNGKLEELKPQPTEIDSVMWKEQNEVLENSFRIKNADWTRVEYLHEFLIWLNAELKK